MQTVLFVVFCCFPFSRLVRLVVIRCTCCSSCFPYVSKKTQQRLAAFPENAARKSCSLLFPFQQACLTLKFHSMVPFLAMAKLERARFCAWLIESVVIRCTCCSSCFPYISKKTQQRRAAFPEKAAAKVVLCCFPFSRLVSRIACCPGEA